MGYGMGAAIGAKIGNPLRPVALVTGDGSFHMNLNEIATSVSQKLPLIVLVFNNSVLGMVHQWQALFYEKRYSHTELNRATDYVKLARAFGAEGFRIEHKKEIKAVLEKALLSQKTCIIDCVIDATERVFPIIPPGRTGEDMIFSD
jgi:acetolactate synthase-1/2/3 large subunit